MVFEIVKIFAVAVVGINAGYAVSKFVGVIIDFYQQYKQHFK